MASAEQNTVKCDFFTSTFISGLEALRSENQLNDVVLKVHGREFNCHKLVLAANSKYFSSIFTVDGQRPRKRKKTKKKAGFEANNCSYSAHNLHISSSKDFKERRFDEITMPKEIDAKAMETLLNYFYTGELVLSQDNIESLFIATDYMRLDPLLEICIENMQTMLNPSNCVRRYITADPIQYSSPRFDSFRKAASALIIGEAAKVSATTDFLNLSKELISKILMSNSSPDKAESLYLVILKWVGHNEKDRRQFLGDLLQILPIAGISNKFFSSKIRNEKLLLENSKSLLWLLNNATSRIPEALSSQMNSFFFANRGSNRKCFYVNVQSRAPLAISDRPEVSDFAAVSYKKKIYLLCGIGSDNSYHLNDSNGSWIKCDLDHQFGRHRAGCVVHGDELYVVGGCGLDNETKLGTCTKFNFVSERKENLPNMKVARDLPGAAIYANSLYATFGAISLNSNNYHYNDFYNRGPSNQSDRFVERYDSREGRWSFVSFSDCTQTFGMCSSATVGDYLYCCDVKTGNLQRFDFRANKCQKLCSVPSGSGSWYWIAALEDELYGTVCGSILKYNGVANKWNKVCKGKDLEDYIIVPWM